MYLAEKTGKFFPQDMRKRYEVIQWLMFQMGGVGPMFGQANYFFRLTEKVPYAIERFHKEALRLYKVLDQQLGKKEYLAGEYYDCRYRHVPLGLAARDASGEIGGISERETLVRRDFGAAGGSARDGGAEGLV